MSAEGEHDLEVLLMNEDIFPSLKGFQSHALANDRSIHDERENYEAWGRKWAKELGHRMSTFVTVEATRRTTRTTVRSTPSSGSTSRDAAVRPGITEMIQDRMQGGGHG